MANETPDGDGTGTGDTDAAAAAAAKQAADTAAAERAKVGAEAVEAYKASLPKAPETYTLNLPEKTSLQASAVQSVSAYAKAHGLSQDAAAALMGLLHGEATASTTAYEKAREPGGTTYAARKAEWEQAAQQDPEIGGVQWPATVEYAKRGLHTFASPGLKTLLESNAMASHPEVIRLFAQLGKLGAEGKIRSTGHGTQPTLKSPGEVLFARTRQQEAEGTAVVGA